MVQFRRPLGLRAGQVARAASPTAASIVGAPTPGAHLRAGRVGQLPARGARPDLGETAQTSVTFTVGWSGDQTADTPDLLDITLDKASYRAGESMQAARQPRFAGKATLGGRERQGARHPRRRRRGRTARRVDPGAGRMGHRAPISSRSRTGRSIRPRSGMPGRSLGLAWFDIDQDDALARREARRRRRRCARAARSRLPIRARRPCRGRGGARHRRGGRCRHPQPHPLRAARSAGPFLRPAAALDGDPRSLRLPHRRHAGHARRDPLRRRRSRRRSTAIPPTQEPLARYSGVVKVGPDGAANVDFDIPAFNGTARVMAVAWTKDRVGSASDRRDRPRSGRARRARCRASSRSATGRASSCRSTMSRAPAGDYTRRSRHSRAGRRAGAMRCGRRCGSTRTAKRQHRHSGHGGRAGHGRDRRDVCGRRLRGRRRRFTRARSSPAAAASCAAPCAPLDRGRALDDLAGSRRRHPAGHRRGVGLGLAARGASTCRGCCRRSTAILMAAPSRPSAAPCRCFTSTGWPTRSSSSLDDKADERVRERDRARAGAAGFERLVRAVVRRRRRPLARRLRDRLPDPGARARFRRAAGRLQSRPRPAAQFRRQHDARSRTTRQELAYAAYVLARNGRPVMGDLRYLADTKLGDFGSPLARGADRARRWRCSAIAAASQTAFAVGRRAAARDARRRRLSRPTTARACATAPALLTLAAEAGAERDAIVQPISRVSKRSAATAARTSTQEQAWMVLAAQALAQDAEAMALRSTAPTHRAPSTAPTGGGARRASR